MAWEPQEPYCESGEITWSERLLVVLAVAMASLVVAAAVCGLLRLVAAVACGVLKLMGVV